MIDIVDKEMCCGCEACIQVCPKQCISIEIDEEGYLYPKVEIDDCISCGLCDSVCPVINQKEIPAEKPRAYAVVNNDDKIVNDSSSGGAFSALAIEVIKSGGIVFGAVFDENKSVKHVWTDNVVDLSHMRGSKYMQSRIENSYIEVKKNLGEGRLVLFSGTPCQIAGLNLFLKKEYVNLITVDFFCHGVPSSSMWQKFLSEEVKFTPQNIQFRDKKNGWQKYNLTIQGGEHSYSRYHSADDCYFMRAFLHDICVRPSCFNCPAKAGKSNASITLADFWGIEISYPEYWRQSGVSLCLTRFASLINELESVEAYEVDYDKALSHASPAYTESAIPHKHRDEFFELLRNGQTFVRAVDELDKMSGFELLQVLYKKVKWRVNFYSKKFFR